ncbi:copper chaperone PCu(A)C [Brevibacterium jeotgali]|uniref:Copper(I)-binding protein n=1 Tax=Brevibacterium jeotgali TaxID=1262550 RepID=A0A2H1L1G2_9MICO|nr:copper chaperone PCu(A)C [Brevibacterium jeotgali]TWC02029.1 hypothetical protein FB108_0692 [Brevibacterium jeotgali]SMY10620.1 hypothetical protein BJEO58_00191 [Brevibacterium jeotgali]
MRIQKTAVLLSSTAAAALVLVTGCSASGDGSDSTGDASSTVTVEDPWVKAADEGMTSSFGLVENAGEADVTLVAVESAIAEDIELHQTSDDGSGAMSMEEKQGGFTITAGDSLDLAPGGDHIMFMDIDGPLQAGDTVDLTLVFSDDSRLDYEASIRDFAGADESYGDEESHGHEGHEDHDGQESEDDHADHDLGDGDDS